MSTWTQRAEWWLLETKEWEGRRDTGQGRQCYQLDKENPICVQHEWLSVCMPLHRVVLASLTHSSHKSYIST